MNYDKLTKEQIIKLLDDALDFVGEQEQKIGKLTAESTEWESKFYDEAKKVDKAIEYIEYYLAKGKTKNHRKFDTSVLDILKGVDKE